MTEYYKKSHCKYLIKIHLVFVTKYRKNIIDSNFRDDLLQIIYDISLEKGFTINIMESDNDHLQILIDIPPQISVQQIVHQIKQLSTFRIYQLHRRYLKQYYWKENTLWSDGYFACSTGDASSETIRRYIEQQG
jgi:putative transposase